MSDSDDFSDAGEEVTNKVNTVNNHVRRVNKNGVKVRGPDKDWVEVSRFPNAEEFEGSDIAKTLKKDFSRRKNREFDYADVQMYECKYSRKVGYKPCPLKMRISFLSHNSQVVVERLEEVGEHEHEEDVESHGQSSSNYRWTEEMTKIISEHIYEKPNRILRRLKETNVFVGRNVPSKQQLYNKIAATKKNILPSKTVRNTHELRENIADYLAVPESEIEAFVPYHEIVDDDDSKPPRFIVIFSTKKNLSRLKSDRVLQTDATYRLNWQGFPVWVVGKFACLNCFIIIICKCYIAGTSSPTGRFFGSCAILASHEDSETWAAIYKFVHDYNNIVPTYQLGDGAKAITKAGNEVFAGHSFYRLMCWSHVHSNIIPQLKSVCTQNKSVHDKLLGDLVNIQWSALNEASFKKSVELLEKKYLDQADTVLKSVISNFFEYLRKVWINSEEFRWYEGAHPWCISNNQGVEGKNKEIKQSHTFRRRLEIGELLSVLARLVTEWSEEDDHLLNSSRLSSLYGEPNSLSLRTSGYQWYRVNKVGTDKILRVNPKDKYTVSESSEFNLGKVDNIWVVNSSEGLKSGKSLKERAKERLASRKIPSSSNFDDYIKVRSSCWFLEERDGDFFCDCPVGMKVFNMLS